MADPICRWRNPYLDNVIELISYLPKTELPKAVAREFINEKFGGNFFHTPYQLACQLGLYHENDHSFFPKFRHSPSKEEVSNYLINWLKHYCVPNPYTKRGFKNVTPFSIHAELCKKLHTLQRTIEWDEIEIELFGEIIGNFDILKNSINEYSNVIKIEQKLISLKDGIKYSDIKSHILADVSDERNNKEYFFDLFPMPNEIENESDNWEDLQNFGVSEEEINQLKEIDNNNDFTQTEKVQLVKSRIGQGIFRRNLISDCGFCAITGINESRFLIASHIKPWSKSNNDDRLNQKNGLLLTPTYDKLFDQGFISFNTNKTLIISNQVSQINRDRFYISNNMNIPLLPVEGRERYLEYHRDELFRR
ncbi:MAG: HNH endonuclease [Nonlabens sp.]|uniref:HNH endonuclease n=1 Tax=Nonlabens sp. TaxID=1888209 RepID=UPI003EF5763F